VNSDFPDPAAINTCFAEYTGDNTTDFASTDNSAVQSAVDAVISGGTVKVAGRCPGVQVHNGFTQTVYISKNLTLQGGHTMSNWSLAPNPDDYTTTLDAISSGWVAFITGTVDVTLDGLTLTGGKEEFGGGVRTNPGAALWLKDSSVFSNTAVVGGGVYNHGSTFTMTNSTIFSNTADQGAGIFNYVVTSTLIDSTINHNSADLQGGGIWNAEANFIISATTISHNSAYMQGGGLWNTDFTSTMMNCIISDNSTESQGGGFWNHDGLFSVDNSTISGNSAKHEGGGLWNYAITSTLKNSTIDGNSAGFFGGGFWNVDIQETIINSAISGNSSGYQGGGFWTSSVTSTVSDSTLSDNVAVIAGGGIAALSGSTMTVTNSTIIGNEVTTSTFSTDIGGGGIYLFNDAGINLQYSTIVSNTAPNISGRDGIVLTNTSRINFSNSILAYNGAVNCTPSNLSIINDDGYNMEDADTCSLSASSSITDTDPLLAPLADNGGDTWTNALLPGSPAIDVIPPGTNSCGTTIATDQRGISRPQWTGCEIGAYEAESPELKVITAGNGSGGVTSDPTGINCGTTSGIDCSEIYAYGTVVTLTTTLGPHSNFTGWSGACSGTGICTVTMTEAKAVTATFNDIAVYLPLVSR